MAVLLYFGGAALVIAFTVALTTAKTGRRYGAVLPAELLQQLAAL